MGLVGGGRPASSFTPRGCRALAAGQVVASGFGPLVQLGATDYDTDAIADLANDRLVVPPGMAGLWLVAWHFSGANAAGVAWNVSIYRNDAALGTDEANTDSAATWATNATITGPRANGAALVELAAGDTLAMYAYQNSGADQAIKAPPTALSALYLGAL